MFRRWRRTRCGTCGKKGTRLAFILDDGDTYTACTICDGPVVQMLRDLNRRGYPV